jgi:hypothetical protein
VRIYNGCGPGVSNSFMEGLSRDWNRWVLEQMGVGTDGCWNRWVLEQTGVGTDGCWNRRVLEQTGVGTDGLEADAGKLF